VSKKQELNIRSLFPSQFQSFEFYNSQQQPDGRPPWLQQWDYDNSRVQRANNYPRHGQRQFRQNPRQPAQQPRQDRRQPLLDNPQPQQQQQRQDRRQPLLENPQPQPESSTQNWPNLSKYIIPPQYFKSFAKKHLNFQRWLQEEAKSATEKIRRRVVWIWATWTQVEQGR